MPKPILLTCGLLALAGLTGCDRLDAAQKAFRDPGKTPATVAPAQPSPDPATPPAPVKPLTPTSRGLPVKALPYPELQTSASVVEVTPLTKQGDMGGKLFGTAGGDPAMNGLYVYLGFFRSPAEGWWVYQLGDFLSYRVLNEVPGQVDVEVEESVMDPATGQIGSRTRRIIIAFQVGPVGDQPVSVRFMPAA